MQPERRVHRLDNYYHYMATTVCGRDRRHVEYAVNDRKPAKNACKKCWPEKRTK